MSAHGHGHAHTHDHIDWAARIPDLRQADTLHAAAFADIAMRLSASLPDNATVVDVGSGAGGMSRALAAVLAQRGGGTLLLVDAVPELLTVAADNARNGAEDPAAALGAAFVGPHVSAAPDGARSAAAEGTDRASGAAADWIDGASGAAADWIDGASGAAADWIDGASAAAEGTDGVSGAAANRIDDASGAVTDAAGAGGVTGKVEIRTVHADVAERSLSELVPAADLIWAASMVHHLPDQQAGISAFVTALASGGVLAVAEGGLEKQTLPWDLGVGRPGLERRLRAARDDEFGEMRASIDGTVRMPYGWSTALARAGLHDVSSFSSLVDHPAPPTDSVRAYVISGLSDIAETVDERLTDEDREAVRKLLDPDGPDYLGRRDDLYLLATRTVHFGRK